MSIETADWTQVQSILHDTYQIWSPGLSRDQYNHFIWKQINHRWSRKNYRYLIYRTGSETLSSCKFYSLEFTCRGNHYPIAGIGAVFTPPSRQGQGHASCMLSSLIVQAKDSGYQGLMLFSDIGTSFYQVLGFQPLPGYDFWIQLHNLPEPDSTCRGYRIRPLEIADVPFVQQHYIRWLRRQPYGIYRSTDYLHFKLSKEIFLHQQSGWGWPKLEILTLEAEDGYALIECSGQVMRILEVVGSDNIKLGLWEALIDQAKQRQILRIRGWQAQAPLHLPVTFMPRNWGLPLMLPLSPATQGWAAQPFCHLLELDHI